MNEPRAPVPLPEGDHGIRVIRGSPDCRDWNGIHYKAGLHAGNVQSRQLSMNVATIPPGGTAWAHIHDGFEVMLYILHGHVRHTYGPDLRYSIDNAAGDFIFIEPGVPHEVYNLSHSEPVHAVVARSAADEWERIVPYPTGKGDRRA
ncbi:MAG: cupin domain-containing protein [Gemmatimonadetes bacterium]|nr:cupin domain-containing protein [Gemmatimonadota bacterium]